jgi:uncharacterized protein (DUF58 family)
LSLAAAALVSGFRPLYVLLYAFVGVSAFSYVWARVQAAGLEATIDALDRFPQAGFPLGLALSLEEQLHTRRWGLRVAVARGDDEAQIGESVTVDVPARNVVSWTVMLDGYPRGLNSVGPLTVESTGPLGLVKVTRYLGEPKRVLVYPRTLPLAGAAAGLGMRGETTGAARRVQGISAASRVREYASSDALSHIHWPTSARLDRLMTRELDDGGLGEEVWIVLDLQQAMQAGTGDESTEEYAVTIAASLCDALLEQDAPVGLLARGERLHRVPPGRGPEQLAAIMEELALAEATGFVPLAQLLQEHAEAMGALSNVLTVAPRRAGEPGPTLAGPNRGDAAFVSILLDADSFDGRAAGPFSSDAHVIACGDDIAQALDQILASAAASFGAMVS